MAANVITDPLIQHGPFRVYARTDGQFAVVDERRPPGYRTVAVLKTKEAAAQSAKANAELEQSSNAGL